MTSLTLAALLLLPLQAQESPADSRQPARGSLAGIMRPDDYPAGAANRGAQGTVGIHLDVGRDGRVTGCRVVESSGHADLDSRTCEIVRERARYEPARDASGRATSDTASAHISWRLADYEGPEAMAFASFRMASTLASSGDGTISCRVEVNGEASPPASGDQCTAMLPSPGMQLPSRAGSQFEFTAVVAFTPIGASPVASNRSDYGTMVGQAEAEIRISPEGGVENCRVTEVTGGAANATDFCEFILAGGAPAFETTKQEGPRIGRMRVTSYMRVTTAT